MKVDRPDKRGFDKFKAVQPKSFRLSQEAVVKTHYLNEHLLPLVLEPELENINLATWAENAKQFIESQLLKHGAILFRNFNVRKEDYLNDFINAVSGSPLEYNERSSPRKQISGNIYTSTEHPAGQIIFLHNEQSYNNTFPAKVFFHCAQPAQHGGETPIADCRKIFRRLAATIKDKFMRKNYLYVRNFGTGMDLGWQVAFQTEDRRVVEEYCRNNDIAFEWKGGDRLKTWQARRVIAKRPVTGEPSWFNHLTFFHVSTLEPAAREALLSQFNEQDLPNNTYYGDGSSIEPSVLDELRGAYLREKVSFAWQAGDILMADNMLVAHGRETFTGPRRVLFGMAEPVSWKNC